MASGGDLFLDRCTKIIAEMAVKDMSITEELKEELGKKSAEIWATELSKLVPAKVKKLLGRESPPTLDELSQLAWARSVNFDVYGCLCPCADYLKVSISSIS